MYVPSDKISTCKFCRCVLIRREIDELGDECAYCGIGRRVSHNLRWSALIIALRLGYPLQVIDLEP
jgi:hypothetical protein